MSADTPATFARELRLVAADALVVMKGVAAITRSPYLGLIEAEIQRRGAVLRRPVTTEGATCRP